jgi:hypothetical protein
MPSEDTDPIKGLEIHCRTPPSSLGTTTALLGFSDGNWGIRISMRCPLPLSGDIRRNQGQWSGLCRSVITTYMKCRLDRFNDVSQGSLYSEYYRVLPLLCLGFGLGTG